MILNKINPEGRIIASKPRMMKNDPPNTIAKGTTFKGKNCIKTIKIIPNSALIQREFHIASYNARNVYLLYNPLFYRSCCFLS